uniref:Uncharacterized protein n=1 Tax=Cannabis sativa TaxID=3483 RepID=A0A803QCE3_CANSA
MAKPLSSKRKELSESSRSCNTMSGQLRGAYRSARMSLYGRPRLGHKLVNQKVTFRPRKGPFGQGSLTSARRVCTKADLHLQRLASTYKAWPKAGHH